jgi:hypothetical protein
MPPITAARTINAGSRIMGSKAPDQRGRRVLREAEQQCLVRDANEVEERRNITLDANGARSELRCECGDPSCQALLSLTHTEYEAVRSYGSRFAIGVNHENPENACVLSENGRFAVIDVVAGEARYQVLARNPRHAWVAAQEGNGR